MDEVLKGIPRVGSYIDDVIVAGSDMDDCQNALELVLQRFCAFIITLNVDKCRFYQSSVTYFGHKVTAEGIYPADAKVQDILEAPEPSSVEVWPMSSTTTTKTAERLRNVFAAYGLPEKLVSDNGPQFKSVEFSDFLECNGVKQVRAAPYHPTSNGAAERTVQTIKRALLKQVMERDVIACGRFRSVLIICSSPAEICQAV
ncbi:uncharacterized protein [Dermacentor andersoni]|uniref:uncharacterized protein n=1 Tax=Dermacentor andersoni TaxID=34620 RepID=UPI0024177EBC|nr:uncharacterized protein LOC129385910 [Dermacentor andersoni]